MTPLLLLLLAATPRPIRGDRDPSDGGRYVHRGRDRPGERCPRGDFGGAISLNGSAAAMAASGKTETSEGKLRLFLTLRWADVPEDWVNRFRPGGFDYRVRGRIGGREEIDWSGSLKWEEVPVEAGRETGERYLRLESIDLAHFSLLQSEARALVKVTKPLLLPDQARRGRVHARRRRAGSRNGPLAGNAPAGGAGEPADAPRRDRARTTARGRRRRPAFRRRDRGEADRQAARENAGGRHRGAARSLRPPVDSLRMSASGGAPSRVSVRREDAVVRIALARPEVRNAFDDALIAELTEAFRRVSDDPGARVVRPAGRGALLLRRRRRRLDAEGGELLARRQRGRRGANGADAPGDRRLREAGRRPGPRARHRRRRRTGRGGRHRDRGGGNGLLARGGQARYPPLGHLPVRSARHRGAPGARSLPDRGPFRRAGGVAHRARPPGRAPGRARSGRTEEGRLPPDFGARSDRRRQAADRTGRRPLARKKRCR